MKKKSIDLAKLELNKKKISTLSTSLMENVKGGDGDTGDTGDTTELWGSRLVCTTSNVGTCSTASCNNQLGGVTILCIPLNRG